MILDNERQLDRYQYTTCTCIVKQLPNYISDRDDNDKAATSRKKGLKSF